MENFKKCFFKLGIIFFTVNGFSQISLTDIQSFSTPDKVNTKIGTLAFKDGIPSESTQKTLWDQLDYLHGVDAFMNGFPAVSRYAIYKGFEDQAIHENEVLVFSKLMDSKSLFLTANADTYYFWSNLNLSKGPLVIETPPESLGIFNDMWWNWIGDFGVSGADRGVGGKYLIVPPGYTGPLPEEGYFIRHAKTNRVLLLGRCFIDEKPVDQVDAMVKQTLKIYNYQHGGYGTSIASFLDGTSTLGALSKPPETVFKEGSGLVINTIPPNDFSFYEKLNEVVQSEPIDALDPEIAGQMASVGIVKGKPFAPDTRMRNILVESVKTANAMSRLISTSARKSEGFGYYSEESHWYNSLFIGGYDFIVPPPEITREGVKPYPSDGAKKLNSRVGMFYVATGITPAMCMRLPGLGSQYLASCYDSKGQPFDGGKLYKIVIPANIPAAKFWSLTLYDNQSRSMLATPQGSPRAGSQSYPSPAAVADADGTTTIYFGPKKPTDAKAGNWIQTTTGKGWFTLFRLYSPKESFFDKTWKINEIDEVK